MNYSDLLAQSIELWKSGCDRLAIVTSSADTDTHRLCESSGVDYIVTDLFYADGAVFNKSSAMSWAYELRRGDDWQLFFDSDIVPPANWRSQIPDDLEPGRLYGCHRLIDGRRFPDRELAGFFQLFHASDPCAQKRPIFSGWKTASGYDSEFQFRWGNKKSWLDLEVVHLGPPGRNWCGRGNDAGMRQLMQERRLRGGYKHEQMNDITM